MLKVIYQIDNLPEGECKKGKYKQARNKDTTEAMRNYTMPSVERYASRIGADYIVIKSLPAEAERIAHQYSKSVFSKIFLFRKFLNDRRLYDKFLFIDCDFFVEVTANDIFEDYAHEDASFCICRASSKVELRYRKKVHELFGERVNDFYNSGIFLSDRPAARKINNAIPNSIIEKIYPADNEAGFYNEAFFGWMLHRANVKPFSLSPAWNVPWNHTDWRSPHPEEWIKMKHYMDEAGKLKIKELHHFNETA